MYPALAEGVFFLLIPLLNKWFGYKTGLRAMFIGHTLAIGYFTTLLGAIGNELAYAGFLCIVAMMIFEDWPSRISCLGTIMLMTVLIQLNEEHPLLEPIYLAPATRKTVHWLVIFCFFFLLVSVMFGYESDKKQNMKTKDLLMRSVQEMNQAITVYVRETSHELRAPLNVVYGLVQYYADKISTARSGVEIPNADLQAALYACQNVQPLSTMCWYGAG